jgi:hypothetical protein
MPKTIIINFSLLIKIVTTNSHDNHTIIYCYLAGCTTRISALTLVATKNIDLNASKLNVRNGNRYNGEDCSFAL